MFKEQQVFTKSKYLGEDYNDKYISKNPKRVERGIKLASICENCGIVYGKHSAPGELCPNNPPMFINSCLMYFDYACFKYYQERSLHVL